jgi:hypothetical protein
MGMYTVISASKEQIDKFVEKHLRGKLKINFLGLNKKLIPAIISRSFSYDNEDSVGFVELYTITGKKISYQLRRGEPMFIEITGYGDIRYDVSYPEQINKEFYKILKEEGKKTSEDFWKGGDI